MSQKKLSKKQKEALEKKQRQQKRIAGMLIVVVILACAGGIGWTVYKNHQKEVQQKEAQAQRKRQMEQSRQNTNSQTVNVDPILDYLSGLDNELLNEELSGGNEEASTEATSGEDAQTQ